MQKQELPEPPSPSPLMTKKKSSLSVKPDDFTIKYRLGKGAYGDVFLAVKNSDGREYAMKQIMKRKLQKQKKEYQALIEKELLSNIKHPAIIKLKYAFQDSKILYFLLELCEGGEFTEFIRLNIKQLTQQAKVFYIAEIVNLLEYLHSNGITHRDIKPENMMLDSYGHLKLIDFGTAEISNAAIISKQFKERIVKLKQKEEEQLENDEFQYDPEDEELMLSPKKKERRSTFVGTCYYISPELLEKNECPPPADLWALGCIIYQLYYLESPFKDNYEFAVFEKIKKAEVHFPPSESITPETVDLIKKLLVKDPNQRLGSGSSEDLTYAKLKTHPFFGGLDVDQIFSSQTPQIPNLVIPEKSKQAKKQQKEKIFKNNAELNALVAKELEEHSDIAMHGIVERRIFITYSSCYLILYDNGMLFRIIHEGPEQRKQLLLKPNSPAKTLNDTRFELTTVEKTYHFESPLAEKWVALINETTNKNNT